jgi:Flp pilus assembly protein TadG
MKRTKNRRAGSAMLEFTLVAIPIIFVLISIFEMSRGMWVYHTQAYALKEGIRFAIVKGQNCSTPPNACGATIADVARRIKNSGVGLLPSELQLQFVSALGTVACELDECLNNTSAWPPAAANAPGQSISVSGTYPFRSAISMFWPGAGTSQGFGVFNLPASSRETIQF